MIEQLCSFFGNIISHLGFIGREIGHWLGIISQQGCQKNNKQTRRLADKNKLHFVENCVVQAFHCTIISLISAGELRGCGRM